jgi:hypothetical protein
MKFFFLNFFKKTYLHKKINWLSYNFDINIKFIPFFKTYTSIFYFFLPILELEYTNYNKLNFHKKKIWLPKIRYKPGYQVIWRFYRKKWVDLLTPFEYRQRRLTHIIYLFSLKNYFFFNIHFKKNNKTSFNDPSKHLLNWKYIV